MHGIGKAGSRAGGSIAVHALHLDKHGSLGCLVLVDHGSFYFAGFSNRRQFFLSEFGKRKSIGIGTVVFAAMTSFAARRVIQHAPEFNVSAPLWGGLELAAQGKRSTSRTQYFEKSSSVD
jgi:hypothetical protein